LAAVSSATFSMAESRRHLLMTSEWFAIGCARSSARSACHPAIARLIARDDVRRQKQTASTYAFSWDIRAYVAAVQAIVANETASISADKVQRWSEWALAQADRIDPVRSGHFIDSFDEKDDTN
jgi:hypothetical protein